MQHSVAQQVSCDADWLSASPPWLVSRFAGLAIGVAQAAGRVRSVPGSGGINRGRRPAAEQPHPLSVGVQHYATSYLNRAALNFPGPCAAITNAAETPLYRAFP